ncbi:MAG: hypothetical protein ACI8PZ_005672 [Myxococcota bacterium]|jgi:hypothetical protein
MYLLLVVGLLGCKPPPEAPQGLDESTRYLVRNFYTADADFQAGVQGFVDWYEDEGVDLVGEAANTDTLDAYTIGDLSPSDIAHLPIENRILLNMDKDEWGQRDLSRAKGVVSLAEMDCKWTKAEKLLVRGDQDVVFSDDFEGYERTYVSKRTAFEGATSALEFDAVKEDLDPWAPDFEPADFERSLLLTENMIDPTRVLVADMESYAMNLDLRHGQFEIGEDELGVLSIVTYNIEAAWGSKGENALLQSYSVEINVERPGNKTLRMLAVWAEPLGGGIEPDSALALNFAVNKSLASSERLSDICAGEIEL